MKRILALVTPMLVLVGSVAAAPGLNLGWNLACPTTAASAPDMAARRVSWGRVKSLYR